MLWLAISDMVGIMDRTRVSIMIMIKERAWVRSVITYSTLLLVCCMNVCS